MRCPDRAVFRSIQRIGSWLGSHDLYGAFRYTLWTWFDCIRCIFHNTIFHRVQEHFEERKGSIILYLVRCGYAWCLVHLSDFS